MKMLKSAAVLSLIVLLSACTGKNNEALEFTSVIEGTTVQVPALTGGQILDIFVDTGVAVTKNTRIMQIDTVEISLQKSELQGVLAEIAASEMIAKTKLQKAEDDYLYLQQKYQRFKKLFAQKTVNQQTMDDLKNKLDAVKSAKIIAGQQFNTFAAKRKQLLAKRDLLIKRIKDANILAPIDGIITEKYFELSEAVAPKQPVVEITDLHNVWAKIYLPETLLGKVKIGQEVTITPDGMEEILSGKVRWINARAEFSPKNILTPETRTSLVYAAKVEIDNPEQILKIGMPVALKF